MAKTPRREWSSMSWLSCACQKRSSESRSAPIRRLTRSTYWLCKLSCEHERRHGRKASRRCCSRCPYVGFNRQSRRWRLWSENSAGYEDTVDKPCRAWIRESICRKKLWECFICSNTVEPIREWNSHHVEVVEDIWNSSFEAETCFAEGADAEKHPYDFGA